MVLKAQVIHTNIYAIQLIVSAMADEYNYV